MSQPTSLSRENIPNLIDPIKFKSPAFARALWEGWKRVARKIGDFQARLLLTVFYIFVIGPFALLIRWRGDPLLIKSAAPRGWLPYGVKKGTPAERATQQF